MAISEACKFEIKEEVDGMLVRGDAATKSEAFDAMVKFYETIGIAISKDTIRTKYYRADGVSNGTQQKNENNSSTNTEIKQIKREPAKDGTMRGGPRVGSGRPSKNKPAPEAPVHAKPILNRYCFTMQYVDMAINQLKNIKKDDPRRVEALHRVKEWVEQELKN